MNTLDEATKEALILADKYKLQDLDPTKKACVQLAKAYRNILTDLSILEKKLLDSQVTLRDWSSSEMEAFITTVKDRELDAQPRK